jgi:DNA primase
MLIEDIKQTRTIESELTAAGVELQQRGSRLVGSCPLHGEKNPSFYVFQDEQRFKCFGCQACGDVIDLVQKLYNLDFKGALKHLGVDDGQFKLSAEEKKKVAAARSAKEQRQVRRQWLEDKIDELSLYIRCAHLLIDGIKTEDDLEERWFLYHLLPVWKYQLGILLDGTNFEKWEFYRYDRPDRNQKPSRKINER